jgi:hypothetical protein
VYQDAHIKEGDLVFVRLVDGLDVRFDYELGSEAPADLQLDGRMLAVLSTADGWTHEIPLSAGSAAGQQLTLRGYLDIAAVKRKLARIQKLTGMAPGTYMVSIQPRVDVSGTLAGEAVEETFEPVLPFRLNEIQLGLVRQHTSGRERPLEEILRPVEENTITTKQATAGPLAFAGRDWPALAMRRIGVAGAGVSLLALIALALVWRSRRPGDEASRIAARFGSLLIPVTDGPDLRHETVDVSDFDTLVRLANQFEQPIMHRALRDGSHAYVLYYDGLAYRYTLAGDGRVLEIVDHTPTAPVHAVLTRPVVAVEELPEEQGMGLPG